MNDNKRQTRTPYNCKHYIVFAPNDRRKVCHEEIPDALMAPAFKHIMQSKQFVMWHPFGQGFESGEIISCKYLRLYR